MVGPLSDETIDRIRTRLQNDLPHEWEKLLLEARGEMTTPAELPADILELTDGLTPLDWREVLTGERPPPDWLWEPVIESGRQVALFADAKAGKSLLMLEACCGITSGRSVLGNPSREPRDVVYIDMENTLDDLADRVTKLGYEHGELTRLHYYSVPNLAHLNTEKGGQQVAALAVKHSASLVVVDTLSRVVNGDENESETYHSFYRCTGMPLKREGVSLVRLDHAGKDVHKGMRGSSAKTTDVDSVWMLQVDGERLTLTRTHTRSAHGADRLELTREDDPLRHVTADFTDHVTQAEARLDLIEYPENGAIRNAYSALKEAGYACDRTHAEDAQRRRKARFEEREVESLLRNPRQNEGSGRPAGPQDGTNGMASGETVLNPKQDGTGRQDGNTEFGPEFRGSEPSCNTTGHPRPEEAGDTGAVPSCASASLRSRTQGAEDAPVLSYVPVDMSFIEEAIGGENQ